MPREDSPYIVGDYWLDKRRDGKSPNIWQIARAESRSIIYRSTKRSELEDAKPVIHAYVALAMAKGKQEEEDAAVLPLLRVYWDEHGKHVVSPDQIASSIRQFTGFLMQDEVGVNVVVADLTPNLFTRFRKWKMGPHDYSVPWEGKIYSQTSKGVKGESVQRYLDDIRAGLLHHVNNRRLKSVPKIDSVPDEYRSDPKDRVLSWKELGAIFGYARHDVGFYQELCLILATTVRPEAARAFDPAEQYNGKLIDLQPPAWRKTKKRNPVLPVIPPFKPVLASWVKVGVKARRSRFNTMRRLLGLGPEVEAKTIRHTVSTMLRADPKVPYEKIEELLGHRVMKKTTAGYAKYDPAYMVVLTKPLTKIYDRVMAEADKWCADHLLTMPKRGQKMRIDKVVR